MIFKGKTIYTVVPLLVIMLIIGFSLACGGYNEVKEKTEELRDDLEEIESSNNEDGGEEESKIEEETEIGMSNEAEYVLSSGNLLTRIGDHIVLIGEIAVEYDYGDITLEEFKAYLGDFIMMFNESYYPEYSELEPPIRYEDHYKYIGRFMEHIERSTKYFQGAIDSEDEGEMLANLDKSLLEIEYGNEWLEKVLEEVTK